MTDPAITRRNSVNVRNGGFPYSATSTYESQKGSADAIPSTSSDEIEYSSWLTPSFTSSLFDHWPVPCVPRHRLPGMAFLCPKALNELKHGARGDELLPGDQIELQYAYTKILAEAGDVIFQFPSHYNDAYELKDHPISKTVGKDCPFFFELGEKLCELIPEPDWPVADLIKILRDAKCQRFVYLQLKKRHVDPSFYNGMTYKERKMYNKLVDADNTLERGNKGTVSLKSFLDSINYYNS